MNGTGRLRGLPVIRPGMLRAGPVAGAKSVGTRVALGALRAIGVRQRRLPLRPVTGPAGGSLIGDTWSGAAG
nr:hypothetical protein GCM10020093_001350 [Planobispora longispora]